MEHDLGVEYHGHVIDLYMSQKRVTTVIGHMYGQMNGWVEINALASLLGKKHPGQKESLTMSSGVATTEGIITLSEHDRTVG